MKTFCLRFFMCLLFISCKENFTEVDVAENTSSFSNISNLSEPVREESINKLMTHDLKIIKTARLRYPTQDLKTSFETLSKVAKIYKAYIQNDNSGTDYGSYYRNVTIRIPNTHFDAFITEISKGVTHFDVKEIAAQDVTEEFVDVTARLKAKRNLESRYLEIVKKATKVSEILEIEKELSKIREEIEVAEGRLHYLENRVAMSTISIEMYTEKAEGTGTRVSYGSKMWNAITSGFNGLSSFFLGLLQIWPFILIFVVVFIFVRRKIRNKKKL
ncbi:DUF4349 domain-containing protein [Flavobacterium sp. TP390]|uniref:DUF4349 domain-containing protein n=1 Tax=Flavobacterium profundi TaxID=1774945 RepID=A0A6I4IUK1_9FLAO|nr:DUF4349 domain-containing protein [Flavobacterium profundi]MVO10560.1 DUF4349 domain-containing protein [Flavobacterium profundi]